MIENTNDSNPYRSENSNPLEKVSSAKIGFLGCGNMGGAIAQSYIARGGNVIASNLDLNLINFDCEKTVDNQYLIDESDAIVLCLKPQIMDQVIKDLDFKDKLIISIAAGKTIDGFEKLLGDIRVVRVMPHMGALIGFGGSAYSMNMNATEQDASTVEEIFGEPIIRVDERLIDYMGYLGAKPGLIAKELEAEMDYLRGKGFSEQNYRKIVPNILRAVAKFLEDGKDLDELYRNVASPGGMTEASHKKAIEREYYKIVQEKIQSAIEKASDLK